MHGTVGSNEEEATNHVKTLNNYKERLPTNESANAKKIEAARSRQRLFETIGIRARNTASENKAKFPQRTSNPVVVTKAAQARQWLFDTIGNDRYDKSIR